MTKISRGSIILLCAIFGVAMLIAAVCSFAYSPYSTDPVEAAQTYASASYTYDPINPNYRNVYFYVYVYYDNTYISSCQISGLSQGSGSGDRHYYNWTGYFSLTPSSGYVWATSSITGQVGVSTDQTSQNSARTNAYNAASSGSTYTFTRSGNNFSRSGGLNNLVRCNTSTSTSYYCALVLKLSMSSSQLSRVGWNISASVSNGGVDKATVDKTSDIYTIAQNTQHTFIFTSLNSNYISSISINNANVTISASSTAPGSFTQTTGAQYKAYRNARNQITVIVTNLTQNTAIVATNRNIAVSLASGSGDKATLENTLAAGGPNFTYTFTANAGNYISTISINGVSIIPPEENGK